MGRIPSKAETRPLRWRSCVKESDYNALAAEVTRLRALMIEMSKHRSSHILEHAVYPSPEEYEAAKARDIHLGPTITYSCGIHNIDMETHGDRCPECDRSRHDRQQR